MAEIANFYESLVFEKITEVSNTRGITLNEESFQDIACLALNQLPPRYVRHSIDTNFYIPDDERAKIDLSVKNAVITAINKVTSNPR